MIRHNEAPESIEVHFVKSQNAPTGMPSYPPVFGALANGLYKAKENAYMTNHLELPSIIFR